MLYGVRQQASGIPLTWNGPSGQVWYSVYMCWPHLGYKTGDGVSRLQDQDCGVQAELRLATLGCDLPSNLHGSHQQLGLPQEVQKRQELNIVLALHWYWGVVFGELTVGSW